ncbi:MAG: hypothetical protein GC185_08825 [Alphaproteobacteria bacterium]|nr:hypothetical protein [Alphaproteobacteria bacterium]
MSAISFSRVFAFFMCGAFVICGAGGARATQDTPQNIPYGAPTYHAHVESVVPLVKGQEAHLSLRLTDGDGDPVTLRKLDPVGDDKINLLVVDQSLQDFQHIFPRPDGMPGNYIFSFTPQQPHDYKVFVEIKPKGKPAQDIPALLPGKEPCKSFCVNKIFAQRVKLEGSSIYVIWDGKTVKAGKDAIGKLYIDEKNSMPFAGLQPVMDGFAYIVGFYDDFSTVQHMYTVGFAPKSPDDRGFTPVIFILHPKRAGFLKYFVQYRAGGKDILLPMGLTVEPADAPDGGPKKP